MTAAEQWIDKRRELLAAATEGPWYWRNTQEVYLFGARSRVVMAFERMGMQGAQPVFRDANGLLFPAGKANLHDIPDARLIADARTSLPRSLDALEKVLTVVGDGDHADTCGSVLSTEDYPCSCWKADIREAIESVLGGESGE